VKLSDMGMASWEDEGGLKTSCGSPHYAAPEVIRVRPVCLPGRLRWFAKSSSSFRELPLTLFPSLPSLSNTQGVPYSGSLADVWSSGIVLFTMFARRLPFDDENIPTLMQKIKHEDFQMPDCIQGPARDLVRRSLEKEAGRRITVRRVLLL
jgi:serine/threonine-protein kinase HSL1 (negative regulator of Swe1 kinase)